MKLKIGDKVRILDGNSIFDEDDVCWVDYGMDRFVGKETYVTHINDFSVLLNIDLGEWWWAEYWLEKIK